MVLSVVTRFAFLFFDSFSKFLFFEKEESKKWSGEIGNSYSSKVMFVLCVALGLSFHSSKIFFLLFRL